MSDSLTPEQRLALINHLTSLTPPEFDKLLFVLNPPNGLVSASSAPQGNRAIELIKWVNSPTGCGMDEFFWQVLASIALLPDKLKPPTPEPQPESEAEPTTDPEAEYLVCQRQDCIYNDIEGYEQRNVLLLRDVFVPLKLTYAGHSFGPMGSRNLDETLFEELLSQDTLKIWDLLRQIPQDPAFSRLVILAQGGYGKTTLLRHITYTYANDGYQQFEVPQFVPVLLQLRKWRDLLAKSDSPDLPTLMTEHHIPALPGGKTVSVPERWANILLKDGKALVLIDGFDEVAESQRKRVSQWINDQMQEYHQNAFILTSRPSGYEYYEGKSNFKSTVFVQPFQPEQWKKFIHQSYLCYERRRRDQSEEHLTAVKAIASERADKLIAQIETSERTDLAEMVTNPLLLNMITALHRNKPGGTLPKYRADLYKAVCQLQLVERPQFKQIRLLLKESDNQQVLQQLALYLQENTVTQISRTDLLGFFTNALEALNKTVKAERYLRWLCQVSELIVERNTDEYEFSHRSFQSYLAAVEVGQRNKEAWLLNQWNHEQDWWQETIILYIAQLDNPNQAIQDLVNRRASDLVYKCLKETSKLIEPELANQVQDLRFQQLEAYLKEGQWEKADIETHQLMLTAVGKEKEQGFTPWELLNIPCEELLTIDGLWVKHSNGKFGFSVQKEIYLECGGSNYSEEEYYRFHSDGVVGGGSEKFSLDEYYDFCDAVDWKSTKFDITSPRGHLPSPGVGYCGWYYRIGRLFALVSRIAKCKA